MTARPFRLRPGRFTRFSAKMALARVRWSNSIRRGPAKPWRDLCRRARVDRYSPTMFQSLGLATVFQEVLVAPDRTAQDNIFLGDDGSCGASPRRNVSARSGTLARSRPRSSICKRQPVLCLWPRASSSSWRGLWSDVRASLFSTKSRPRWISPIASLCFRRWSAFARRRPHPLYFASHGRGAAPGASRHDPAERKNGGHARPRLASPSEMLAPDGARSGRRDCPWALKKSRHGLIVRGLSLLAPRPAIDDSFRPGEIVGFAGLEGHGQEAFLEALCGLRHPARVGSASTRGASGF